MIQHAEDTEHEGLAALQSKIDAGKERETIVSDSTMDRLRESEELKRSYERHMHMRWVGKVIKSFLVWVGAGIMFLLGLVDAVKHFFNFIGGKNG